MRVKVDIITIEMGKKSLSSLFGEVHFEKEKVVVECFSCKGKTGKGTRLEYHDNGLILDRRDELKMIMIFEKGKRHFFTIETEYGSFESELITKEFYLKREEKVHTINVQYALRVSNDKASLKKIEISISEI